MKSFRNIVAKNAGLFVINLLGTLVVIYLLFPYYLVEYNIDIKQRFGSLLICDIKENEKYGIKSELKYHIFSNQHYEGQDNLLKYVSGEIVLCTVQGRNYYVTKAETLKMMNK